MLQVRERRQQRELKQLDLQRQKQAFFTLEDVYCASQTMDEGLSLIHATLLIDV